MTGIFSQCMIGQIFLLGGRVLCEVCDLRPADYTILGIVTERVGVSRSQLDKLTNYGAPYITHALCKLWMRDLIRPTTSKHTWGIFWYIPGNRPKNIMALIHKDSPVAGGGDKRRQELLDLMLTSPNFWHLDDLVSSTGWGKTTIRRHIEALKKTGAIVEQQRRLGDNQRGRPKKVWKAAAMSPDGSVGEIIDEHTAMIDFSLEEPE